MSGRLKKARPPAAEVRVPARQSKEATQDDDLRADTDLLSPISPRSDVSWGAWDTDESCASPRAKVGTRPASQTPVRLPCATIQKASSLPLSHRGVKKKARSEVAMSPRDDGRLVGRRLSFSVDSWDDIAAAIQEVAPQLDWWQASWNRALIGLPSPIFKSASTKSLHHWIGVFNRWQGLGKWTPGQAPTLVDAYQFQELSLLPISKVVELVQLFDPTAHAKIQRTAAIADYQRVRISMPAFLTIAVFLSSSISKKQKLRFLLGVFDEDDNRVFDLEEFVAMLCSLFHGVACVFNLPSAEREARMREQLAKQLYRRIASAKMPEEGPVPSAVIEDWLLGLTSDPLSAPFALFLERFSRSGQTESPDSLEDESRRFYLSHTSPVEPPMMTAAPPDSSFLRRSQIQVVRDLFNHCATARDFAISHEEAQAAVGDIDPEFWIGKLRQALDDLETVRLNGTKFTLSLFFKKLCPRASKQHLRVFESWVAELEGLEALRAEVNRSYDVLESYRQWTLQPPLPASMRQEILQEFMDFEQHAGTRARRTREEFIVAMCPKHFRPKLANRTVETVLDDLLAKHVAREEERLMKTEALFMDQKSPVKKALSKSLFRQSVPEESWQLWNAAFDVLVVESSGRLTGSSLQNSGMVPPEVADHLCRVLSSEKGSISKQVFLQKMSDLSNCRARKGCDEEGGSSGSDADEAPGTLQDAGSLPQIFHRRLGPVAEDGTGELS